MKLTKNEYERANSIVFKDNYPGYRPKIIESPNGDKNWDTEKRYAHIARKYLDQLPGDYGWDSYKFLWNLLVKGLHESRQVAKKLHLPQEFYPTMEDSTLRILEYPSGAVTNPHYDFDLFTLMLYRDTPPAFKYLSEPPDEKIQQTNSQIHYGEIIELVNPKYKATFHEVTAIESYQYSAVFFAMPSHSAVLPDGQTVKEWLTERMSRSRKEK